MKPKVDSFEKHEFFGLLGILCCVAIFASIGAVIFLFEGSDIVRRYSLARNMHITEGTVQRIDVKGFYKNRSFEVFVSFALEPEHGGRTGYGSYKQKLPLFIPSQGEAVTIAYDRDNPRSIEPLSIEIFGVAVAVLRLLVLPVLTCVMAAVATVFIYLCLLFKIDDDRRKAESLAKDWQLSVMPLVEKGESRPPPDLPKPIWTEQGRLSSGDDAGQPGTRQPR